MQNQVQPFRAIEISGLARRLATEGRSVLHMEFGQPSMGPPRKVLDVARAAIDNDRMGYRESPALKERLAALYADRYGVAIDPSRFLLTCGASPALVLALSICFPAGARIAMARPGYVAYRNTVRRSTWCRSSCPAAPKAASSSPPRRSPRSSRRPTA